MKFFIFFIAVLVSGYYLLSKTDEGSAIFSRYLPQHQIDKASDALLKNVDSRLQEVTTKLSLEQQQGLQQLEQRIAALSEKLGQELSQQLNALEKQQAIPKREALQKPEQQAPRTDESTRENKALAQQADAKQQDENFQIEGLLARDEQATMARNKLSYQNDERKALQRQKQASLQFITSRMEQMAVEVSSGTY
jgi:hypothetical protein